jgi:hypothetical protein
MQCAGVLTVPAHVAGPVHGSYSYVRSALSVSQTVPTAETA